MSSAPIADTRPVDRPGALWRVVRFPLTRILIAAIPQLAAMAATDAAVRSPGAAPGTMAGGLLVVAGGAISVALYAGYVRLIERRRLVELGGGRGAAGELAGGFAVGLGLFVVAAGLLVLCGVGRIERGDGGAAIAPWLLWVAGTATAEEIVFRGVMFRIVEERLGSWIALAISALLFGGLHAGNANATVASSLAIALEAGVLLAAAYMASRRLWLPIALHAGWNFAQLGVLGVQRPGHTTVGVWSSRFTGSPLLSGGDWGPEISIVAVGVSVVASILLLAIARWRGRIVAPRACSKTRASSS
jgi:membrane protease YdiL (CAAX protease family)